MTDILLFGRNGQLGNRLQRLLGDRFRVAATDTSEVDFCNPDQVRESVHRYRPSLVINAAAYTAVDKAESDSDTAFAVNAEAPAAMAEAAAQTGAGLLHFSTDFVFDGNKATPYVEEDEARPLNVYGASKLAGEQHILDSDAHALIFRTSWLYGPTGNNFLLTMRRLLSERDELSVVDDQTGTPTSVLELADLVTVGLPDSPSQFADYCRQHRGLYHLSCEGQGTWFEFAAQIRSKLVEDGTAVAELHAIPSSDYPTPAERPGYSLLDKSRFIAEFGRTPANWRADLDRVWQALG